MITRPDLIRKDGDGEGDESKIYSKAPTRMATHDLNDDSRMDKKSFVSGGEEEKKDPQEEHKII